MIVYVAGFAFWKTQVILVEKKLPVWQAGLWNGVGGKAEKHEAPLDAMRREFSEETGISVWDWDHFATEIPRDEVVVHFYRYSFDVNETPSIPECNDVGEKLLWIKSEVANRGLPCIGNLSWLIPLAQDPRGLLRPVRIKCERDIRETPTW